MAEGVDGGGEGFAAAGPARLAGPTRAEDDPLADRDSLGNLSATLGDLANALCAAGRLDEALLTAERCIRIQTRLGNDREIAADLTRFAQILMQQGRYREADERYEAALAAAGRAGDKELEGTVLQNWGILADDMQQYDRAAERYKRALRLFQEAGIEDGVMQTCNLLGVVEQKSARLAEARTWYYERL